MADRPRPRRDGDGPRDRDFRRGRPRRDGDRPAPGGGDRPAQRGGDRPAFRGGDRPSFDRPRRDFDRPRRTFDRPRDTEARRDFDRPRREFDRPFESRGRDGRPRPDDGAPPDRRREPRREPRADFRGEPRRDWQPRGDRRDFRAPRPRRPSGPADEAIQNLAEDEELIAGRRPVEEAFAARRDAIRLLVVPERRAALDQLVIHATTLRIPVVELEGGSLTALAGFDGHQGIALVARPRAPADIEDILAAARARNETPFVLVLDSLEDPQNFGTLLRSAEAVGVHGVIYPTRRAAPLSPAAIKAASGATEHLLLAAVEDLPGILVDLHGRGLRVVAAEEDAAMPYAEADLRGGLALVIGSEGRGISAPVRRRLDLSVRIPMRGKIGSLNAAVAGSILLFAVAAQRPMPPMPAQESDQPPDDSSPAPEADTMTQSPPKRTRRSKAAAPPATSSPDTDPEPADLLPSDS